MPQSSLPPQATQPKVIAAIPCFNTELFIVDLVLKAKKYVEQVIVIDDGSSDGTVEAVQATGAVVLCHGRNLGKGAAMKTAIQNTDADIIVYIDGDGQNEPADIPKIIAPILHGDADLVIGSRHLRESRVSSHPFTRRFSNFVASLTISVIISFFIPLAISLNHLTHCSLLNRGGSGFSARNNQFKTKKWITDCTSGFRGIKKEAWQKLELVSQGFQIETEMIYESAKNGLTIAEVPISCNWNTRLSHLSILRDGLSTLKLLSRKLVNEVRGR